MTSKETQIICVWGNQIKKNEHGTFRLGPAIMLSAQLLPNFNFTFSMLYPISITKSDSIRSYF